MIGEVNPQKNFFDEVIFARIPENDILVKIKKVVDFQAIAKKLECYYDKYQGRPSWPIEMMIKVLFLEIYFNIEDREIERQLRYNFLYRWFCDLSFYDREPDSTTMVKFRERIKDVGARVIFDEIVRQTKEAGVLVGRLKITDATHIHANVARMSVVNFLRHARNKILRLLRKERVGESGLEKEYGDEKKFFGKPKREDVEREVVKTKDFIDKIRKISSEKLLWSAGFFEWVRLLAETMEKITRGDTKDKVASFVDPDARWGHKTKEKTFLGYKVHTVQDESGIVTTMEVVPGNANEGVRLERILEEDDRKGIKGTGVVGDKIFDSGDNRKAVRRFKMIPYILSRTTKRRVDDFDYDMETGTVTCRGGKRPIGSILQENGKLYYFSVKDCKICSHREECLRKSEERVRVYLSDAERDSLLTGKAVTKKEAKKIRSQIEPKYGEAKVWHGLDRARWRREWRVAIQAFITFGVMNAKRLVRLLAKREKVLCPS